MTAEPRRSLFREEVLEHRADRLHGDVHLAVPISWQVIGFTLLFAFAAALVFLGLASYARVETVTGIVALDRGTAPILPTRAGTVSAISVREGQRVAAGELLLQIRAEEDMATGGTTPRRILKALEQQDERLASQSSLVMTAARAEQSRLAAQMTGITEELASLASQIAAQRRLVEVARAEYDEVQGVANRGFISRRDLEAREGALIVRRQQLSQLEQARAVKLADLAEARRAVVQSAASAQAQAAGVQSDRAVVAQQFAQAEAARGYSLTSPIAGIVTALTARLGQPASADRPLMVVMPSNAVAYAELYVPTSAAGFLEPGQEVRLAIDAFPYQRFGSVPARITRISSVTIPRAGPDGAIVPVYLVAAELSQPSVMAFGRRQPLLAGMTLTARIVTDRRSLLEWLFEPVFAVRNR